MIHQEPALPPIGTGGGGGGNGAGRMECSNCLYVDLKETFLGLKHVKRQRGREGGISFCHDKN